MHMFEFTRPQNAASAISTAAQAKTAQQGADVRFLAGGTPGFLGVTLLTL